MPRLNFKRDFHESIRAGRKTSTLRRWSRAKVSAAQTVFSKGLGNIAVIDCHEVELKKLGRADAIADGFESLAELLAAVEKIYPSHKTDGKNWYRVRFQLEEAFAQHSTKDEARLQLAGAIRARLDKAVGIGSGSR